MGLLKKRRKKPLTKAYCVGRYDGLDTCLVDGTACLTDTELAA